MILREKYLLRFCVENEKKHHKRSGITYISIKKNKKCKVDGILKSYNSIAEFSKYSHLVIRNSNL